MLGSPFYSWSVANQAVISHNLFGPQIACLSKEKIGIDDLKSPPVSSKSSAHDHTLKE